MTPNSPSSGDLEQFLNDGRTLQTHISHDRSATISAGRFGSILREQLEVSRAEFWEAIRSGQPVDRPVAIDEEQTVEHEPWVIEVLVGKLYMGPEEIENLSEQAAIDLVHEFWSRGGP